MKRKTTQMLSWSALGVLCAGLLMTTAQAQVGSGWTAWSGLSRTISTESNDVFYYYPYSDTSVSTPYANYTRDSSGVETFTLLDSHSNRIEADQTHPRVATGFYQWEGYVKILAVDASESVVQWKGTTNNNATDIMIRAHPEDNGSIWDGNSTELIGNLGIGSGGAWTRVNLIFDYDNNLIYVFINGQYKKTKTGGGQATHWIQYGCYGSHSGKEQIQWKGVKFLEGLTGTYDVQNRASGLYLNNQGSLNNGTAITQWTASTSDNLKWTFVRTSGGNYQIKSVKSGLDAVVQSASTASGAKIIQWSFGSAGNDLWRPVINSNGSYTFINLHSGLALEDPGSSTSTSTQMDQWTSNGGANQQWNLITQ